MRPLKIATILVMTMAVSAPALAKDLTEAKITDFFEESAEMQQKGKDKALAFLEEHVSDDAVIHLTTMVKMAGDPTTREDVRTFTKREMIDATGDSYDVGEIERVENKIISVEIADDKQSAEVKDTNFTIMSMQMPSADGKGVKFKSETTMFCTDTVIMNKKGVIQISKSECTAEAKIEPLAQ